MVIIVSLEDMPTKYKGFTKPKLKRIFGEMNNIRRVTTMGEMKGFCEYKLIIDKYAIGYG